MIIFIAPTQYSTSTTPHQYMYCSTGTYRYCTLFCWNTGFDRVSAVRAPRIRILVLVLYRYRYTVRPYSTYEYSSLTLGTVQVVL